MFPKTTLSEGNSANEGLLFFFTSTGSPQAACPTVLFPPTRYTTPVPSTPSHHKKPSTTNTRQFATFPGHATHQGTPNILAHAGWVASCAECCSRAGCVAFVLRRQNAATFVCIAKPRAERESVWSLLVPTTCIAAKSGFCQDLPFPENN